MSYLAFTEYQILTKSEWQTIQLNTDQHPYAVQQLKKEDKLLIENTLPSLETFEMYCDSTLFEMCNAILKDQITIQSFLMDLGHHSKHRFSLRLREIIYLDQQQQSQKFVYTYTPANSAAKIQKSKITAITAILISIIALLLLILVLIKTTESSKVWRKINILLLLLNVAILIFSLYTLSL